MLICRLFNLLYKYKILSSVKVKVPVVVVGNINFGGSGKTPLVIELANLLEQNNYKVGIVSRGYKGSLSSKTSVEVTEKYTALEVGDEPLLLKQKTNAKIAICKKRVKACELLLEKYPDLDLILTDDGLQHYNLQRDIEIAVVDGERGLNILLREPKSRLNTVDYIVCKNKKIIENSFLMEYELDRNYIEKFIDKKVHAVAGIANPNSFFKFLSKNNINIIQHKFRDHYEFKKVDLEFNDDLPIVMTEKDFVKCKEFNLENCFAIKMNVKLDNDFKVKFLEHIKSICDLRGKNAR